MKNNANRHFTKEVIWMAVKHAKFSVSLFSRLIQLQATVRIHFLVLTLTIITKTKGNRCWGEYGEQGVVGEDVLWYRYHGDNAEFSSELETIAMVQWSH